MDDISKKFFLISQWLCDGSTGHSEYNQWPLEDARDSDIFTSVDPLQSYSTRTSEDKLIFLAESMAFFGEVLSSNPETV